MPDKAICFFNSSKSWGGGEKWHFDIATRLKAKNYNVIVITNKRSELYTKLCNSNIKTYALNISNVSFLNPFKIYKVFKILGNENISTLIINLPSDLKIASFAAKKARVKKVIYRRGSAIPIKNKFLNRLIFKNYVDEIIANSIETKNTVLSNNPELFDINKIKVIYNGIDTSINIPDKNNIIYNRQKDEILIGNAARFVKQKNHAFLIRLAKKLQESGLKFKLILAGDGKLKSEIETLAQKNNLTDKIIFTGFITDIKSFMNNIDIYVLPSLWEGFGYVLAEAMFCKKPVIAFNISSNPEIIEDKKTGYLVKPDNLTDFTEKVMLLTQNKSLREELGINGEKRVLQYFSINKTIELVENTLA